MDESKSKFLKSLVEYPEETAQAEYKGAIAFDSKSDFEAKLVKHILGQSNAGGGYIIVGFREDGHGGLTPDPALDESVARSYETTRLCQSVDSYVSSGQRIELQVHKVEFQQKMYPIVSVQGFKESPLFCCKDFAGKDGKLILKEGAIYIRDAAAKTVSIAGAQQFSVLLKLAVERRQAETLQQVRALLDGSLSPTALTLDDAQEQEKKAGAWFEAENAVALSEMKKVMPETCPYIEVTHYPLALQRNWSQRELSEAAQKAACHNTGWPMGVVLTRPEVAPKPLKDGIRVASLNRIMHWQRKCEENEITWKKRVPLAAIEPDLEPLVGEATGELFALFEFWQPDESVWKGVLREFLNTRI